MAKDFIDFKRIEKLSEGDISITLQTKIVKLFEEGGELSQAVLKYTGSKSASASAGETKEEVLEEACDCINVLIDIINKLDCTDEEVKEMFDNKLNKWMAKIDKYI